MFVFWWGGGGFIVYATVFKTVLYVFLKKKQLSPSFWGNKEFTNFERNRCLWSSGGKSFTNFETNECLQFLKQTVVYVFWENTLLSTVPA